MPRTPEEALPLNLLPTVSYNRFIDRIYDILRTSDEKFFEKIHTFRRFDLPEQTQGDDFPVLYVTTASTPEVSRDPKYATSDPEALPVERVVLEFWAVILVSEMEQSATQSRLYALTQQAYGILSRNKQLRAPDDRTDPLCTTSRIYTQGRIESHRGKLLEGMTLRIRPVVYTSGEAY